MWIITLATIAATVLILLTLIVVLGIADSRWEQSGRERLFPKSAPPGFDVIEPDLATLLASPEVVSVMRADHVDQRKLLAMLDAISVRLQTKHSATDLVRSDR